MRAQLVLFELQEGSGQDVREESRPPELHGGGGAPDDEVTRRSLQADSGPANLKVEVDERDQDEDGDPHLDDVLFGAQVPLGDVRVCSRGSGWGGRGEGVGGGQRDCKEKGVRLQIKSREVIIHRGKKRRYTDEK